MPKTEERPKETRMSIGEHLEELRRRILRALVGLVLGMVVGLIFAPDIVRMLKEPYVRGMEALGREGNLVVLQATSGLTNYLKVAFYSGLVLGSPWIFYQLWMFVAAGLRDREKRTAPSKCPYPIGNATRYSHSWRCIGWGARNRIRTANSPTSPTARRRFLHTLGMAWRDSPLDCESDRLSLRPRDLQQIDLELPSRA